MPKFHVTVEERREITYCVEADDADEAKDIATPDLSMGDDEYVRDSIMEVSHMHTVPSPEDPKEKR